jgi:hypothetical protein
MWYMVFDKPPCNNRVVPLYFLRKLWDEFILGKHVNYFDMGDLQGVVLESTKDQDHSIHDPMLGPHHPMQRTTPLPNILLLQITCKK